MDPEKESLSGYYHNKVKEIVFSTNNWISYRLSETAYNGDAHEYAEIRVGTVNRRTGNHLFLADIVKKDQKPLLVDAIRAALVKYWELKSPGGSGKNLHAKLKLTEIFYFDKNRLHFVYQEYEIASHAMSAFSIDLCIQWPLPAVQHPE